MTTFTTDEAKSMLILLSAMMDEGAKELFETNGADASATVRKLQAMTGYSSVYVTKVNVPIDISTNGVR